MKIESERILREKKTVQVMIEIYCRKQHGSKEALCSECQDLLTYCLQRVDRCIFEARKPVCAKCPIHCYKNDMRDSIRKVMRFSGPRMLTRHPLLTIYHFLDSRKELNRPPKLLPKQKRE